MSLQILNDENVSGDITAETCDFLFLLPELTGRSSVFCTSQKENVPPKNTAKTMKVTFQTPLRDPQTNRILSPNMTRQLENCFTLDDGTDDLKNSQLPTSRCEKNQQVTKEVDSKTTSEELQRQETNPAPYPDDVLPVKSSDSYNIDLDILDDFNPFVTSSQIPRSYESLLKSEIVLEEEINCYSLDNTLPFISEGFKESPGIKSSKSPGKTLEKTCDSIRSASLVDKSTNEINRDPALKDDSDGNVVIQNLIVNEMVPNKEQKSSLHSGQPEEPLSNTAQDPQSASVSTHLPACNPDFVNNDEKKVIDSELPNFPLAEEKPVQAVGPLKYQPIKLEFDFSDNITLKPPPSKLGKGPAVKPLSKKPPVTQGNVTKNLAKENTCQDKENIDPLPKGSYTLDWDKLNDPNFNPFGEKAKPSTFDRQKSSNETTQHQENHIAQKDCPSTEEQNSVTVIDDISRNQQVIIPVAATADKSVLPVVETLIAVDQEKTENSSDTSVGTSIQVSPLLTTDSELHQKEELDTSAKIKAAISEEDFKSPSQVLGTDIEIDYLEQFGTSLFKESALRKQSLYLKFDPLLKESPNKLDPVTTATTNSLPDFMTSKQSQKNNQDNAKLDEFDFLGTLNIPVIGPPPLDGPECLDILDIPVPVPGLPVSVDSIIDVLKYSQKDMDVAVEKVKQEVKEKEMQIQELEDKHKKFYVKYLEMGKIVEEYEGMITQMIADSQKEKEVTKAEIQKISEEKQQITADLNSMEKSFSDLFKRLEKQREALEGYQKNEEALKKCAQDYLLRIEKGEQRYQALKAHAEEKLNSANEEIAQVRSKAKAETLALQANLRKEQMRVQSLEKTLEQKTKENDELTKICDDLISKMEKI
ncbi:transforming acidic coiled-coil-containing protein 3 isoform X2 [Monodelphis domestica]|uniref:Transforming acidic coiled-coil containing protein 3 n=1 Tax=Monodelphis domestica TaxID=13616 RepID=A0A5F8G3I6_MONDO|nr:transforming acidic coiled-coil-containing protein 3 isoform X2 [Monodelphis domestica]